jgi:hypothetical protein
MTGFRAITGIIILSLAAVLAACDGSSGSGSSEPQTGQVAVLITDGPTDRFEHMIVEVESMSLLGGSGGPQVLYDGGGGSLTFDLLQLRDRSDFAFATTVFAGDYSKIRVNLLGITLIDVVDPADPADDDVVELTKLPANGHFDLNPRGPFTVEPGRTTVIELDMDALRSVQFVQTGNAERILARPVIFANIYQSDIALPNRLVRVFGTIDSVDDTEQSILLCDLQFVAQLGGPAPADPADCVRAFAGGASIFGTDGLSTDFQAIVDALAMAGSDSVELTAIGFPGIPGAGADLAVVLDIEGVVAELGPRMSDMDPVWETTQGMVVSDPMACDLDWCFDFLPESDGMPIGTRLQPESRVFTANGEELAQADISNATTGAVDGLRRDNGGPELLASLFVVGPNVGSEVVSGLFDEPVVPSMIGDYDILTVIKSDDMTDVFVCVDADTEFLQVLVNDDVATIVDILDPSLLDQIPGDGEVLHVEASGTSSDMMVRPDCDFDASVVIVEAATAMPMP